MLNAKLIYTSWEENPAKMIEQSKHREEDGLLSSSISPPPVADGDLAPVRSDFDSAFLEERPVVPFLEEQPVSPFLEERPVSLFLEKQPVSSLLEERPVSSYPIPEEVSDISRPDSPPAPVEMEAATPAPSDNATTVVKPMAECTSLDTISKSTELHESHTDNSSSSASSTATASPNHSPSTTSSISSSTSQPPEAYGTSLQSHRKPRVQKVYGRTGTHGSGKPSTRPRQPSSLKLDVGSFNKAGDNQEKSRGCLQEAVEDNRPSESAIDELDSSQLGKYSPKELVIIQERVRHSLQRQGVVRSENPPTELAIILYKYIQS